MLGESLVHGARILTQEMIDEQRDVLLALAQRRQCDAEDIQAVVEVGAEGSLSHQGVQIPVGGGDGAEIHLDRLVAAHARDLLFLQDAQQVGLRLQADVGNLVEKNRAALGYFELAFLAVLRAGEGALLVAEELAFEQRLGQRAAVDGNHGHEAPRAQIVNGAGHQFLAGAALAVNQHGRVGGATVRMLSSTCCMAGLWPTNSTA